MKLGRILLVCTILVVAINDAVAHKEWVHQHVVRQGYNFLEYQVGAIPELRDRVGLNFYGKADNNDPWASGLIVVGAWREDVEDPIWGNGSAFSGWSASSTHFGLADQGDDVRLPVPASPDAYNAFYKAKIYLFGGHSLFFAKTSYDADIGQIILGRFYSYNSLIEFYKTGRCYSEGYIDLAGYTHYIGLLLNFI